MAEATYSVSLWRDGATEKIVEVTAATAGHAAAKAIDANPDWDAYFVGEEITTADRCECGAIIMLDDWPLCPCGQRVHESHYAVFNS